MDLPQNIFQLDPVTTETVETPFVPDPDNVMMDSKGHGNCIASLATGSTKGVAKKARLVPVKIKNRVGQTTARSLQWAFRYVINDVIATNKISSQRPTSGEKPRPKLNNN